ncbi:hypothetical protein CC78DRAFT_529362 [Lojkania enalia]|uniref:Uncharacterized protein n=1 Tax=Lojkania enalia TaxID=147567 RepID=A0A9P4N9I2_9PLEO|nr:hypothetical protein CC78DRAFT_529362 [Didymosphaeria enalia]
MKRMMGGACSGTLKETILVTWDANGANLSQVRAYNYNYTWGRWQKENRRRMEG